MGLEERRWKKVWVFLSLDITAGFFEDLWFFIGKPDDFRKELRKLLTPAMQEDELSGEPGIIHYLIADWFQNEYGKDSFEHLCSWANNVYIMGGSDRVPESIWSVIIYQLTPEFLVSTTLHDTLTNVRQQHQKDFDSITERLEKASQVPLSEWDRNVMSAGAEPEDVYTDIRLITSCNLFSYAWEQHCFQFRYEELCEIYKLGKQVADRLRMVGVNIGFPGNWRFELQSYFEKLSSIKRNSLM
jgi:hypothetical protein